MKHYIALVHHETDRGYGIQFPDVPGCFSATDDEADIVAMASEALDLHLSDLEAPVARSVAQISSDPTVSRELAEGAFLIAVPFVRRTGQVRRTNITLEQGLLQAIDETAKARGLTRSAFLADLAHQAIFSRSR